ncbi:MAG: chorismate mutase [Oscillospiraceae bacterium]|nr:chorismate mutase [Oscillospiraceae bacterium]
MELKECRNKLDAIDSQLVSLFCERMEIVQKVAEYKKEHELPIHASGREKEILERVRTLSGEELAPYAQTLFETLLYVSREYQKTLL